MHNGYALAASIVYGISLILLYTISCVYHSLSPKLRAKKVLRVIDHCNVFLLVAGTFTPVCLVVLNGVNGWILFGIIWTVTLVGIILNSIDVDKFNMASVACHLLAGWSMLFMINPLMNNFNKMGLIFLVIGGLCYSVGALLYGIGAKKKYFHSVFHFFCLAGSIFHFFMIFSFIL
jgi:hemolysin III